MQKNSIEGNRKEFNDSMCLCIVDDGAMKVAIVHGKTDIQGFQS